MRGGDDAEAEMTDGQSSRQSICRRLSDKASLISTRDVAGGPDRTARWPACVLERMGSAGDCCKCADGGCDVAPHENGSGRLRRPASRRAAAALRRLIATSATPSPCWRPRQDALDTSRRSTDHCELAARLSFHPFRRPSDRLRTFEVPSYLTITALPPTPASTRRAFRLSYRRRNLAAASNETLHRSTRRHITRRRRWRVMTESPGDVYLHRRASWLLLRLFPPQRHRVRVSGLLTTHNNERYDSAYLLCDALRAKDRLRRARRYPNIV